ncbi:MULTISPECIES: hypothetical protein [Paraburkholderia]|uniref:Uncharacterized protein n=1 Tax=Paraburkholderia unamae TaxID=219649 RepID=A0ACC6RT65_9BURK|nr:hypothetical protein [Paraburkholderia nodosa]
MHRLARRGRPGGSVWGGQGDDAARARRGTFAAVLVVAVALACVEREVSGKHEGSLHSLLAPYIVKFTGARVH